MVIYDVDCPYCDTIIEAPTRHRLNALLKHHIKTKHPDKAKDHGL